MGRPREQDTVREGMLSCRDRVKFRSDHLEESRQQQQERLLRTVQEGKTAKPGRMFHRDLRLVDRQ